MVGRHDGATIDIRDRAILVLRSTGTFRHSELVALAVALVVNRVAERAGLDRSASSGHRLRAGFVTTAVVNGASERAIGRQTGRASAGERVFRRVVRQVATSWRAAESSPPVGRCARNGGDVASGVDRAGAAAQGLRRLPEHVHAGARSLR